MQLPQSDAAIRATAAILARDSEMKFK